MVFLIFAAIGLAVLLAVVYANIFPFVADDTAYCTSVALPATEADLGPSVQVTSAAAVNATSLTVAALNAAIAKGTVLYFPVAPGTTEPSVEGNIAVTLTATAAVAATTLSVQAIGAAIAANTYALGQGTPVILPAGTQSILAEVILVTTVATAGVTFVVLQTDLGDGNWYDVAWEKVTAPTTGTATYTLATALGSSTPAVQRANGAAPGTTGANNMPLGPRIRFTGQTTASGGSIVTATVKYKFQGLR